VTRVLLVTAAVLAVSTPALAQDQGGSTPAWLWPALFGVAVTVVGALLTRSINAMDKSIEKLSAELVETRKALADSLNAAQLKVGVLEARFGGLEKRIDDQVAFLAAIGKPPEKP
jgi:hypothetical protein